MADEVNLHYIVDGQPEAVLHTWKQNPPPGAFNGFELVDEAYNSLTFQERYYDWPQKVLFVATLGFALLFKGFMGSTFKLTVRVDPEGERQTRVTLVGTAHPRTREQIRQFIDSQGGATGLRVGV
jgi:hypothetical protein